MENSGTPKTLRALWSFEKFRGQAFREYQEEAVEWVVDNNRKWVVLEAPTGSGKSIIAMVSGRMQGDMTYMVHSKALQRQIVHDFPEAESLFGRGNYLCRRSDDIVSCNECRKVLVGCEYECRYAKQKSRVLGHGLRILNYDYFLTEANYVGMFSGMPYVVIDEADNLETSLLEFISLVFTDAQFRLLGMREPRSKRSSRQMPLGPWMEYVETAIRKASALKARAVSELKSYGDEIVVDRQVQLLKKVAGISRAIAKMKLFLENVDETWLYDDKEPGRYKFRPLWLTTDLCERYLWRHGTRFVLLSATFLPIEILCKILGMPSDQTDYMCMPSTFNPNRRKVYINPVANMSKKTEENELPALISEIRVILERHKHEKGIIHCVSYRVGQKIVDRIKSDRLLIHNHANRQEVFEKFLQDTGNAVMVSPSMERGVSLNFDLCRFVIVAKAPYLSLGEKVVAMRVYASGIGQKWYTAMMLMSVLQGTGRGMRSEDDYCVSYILDGNFSRALQTNAGMLPLWWREAIQMDSEGYKKGGMPEHEYV